MSFNVHSSPNVLELLIGSLSKVWWEKAEEDDIGRQGHRISKWLIIFLTYPFPPSPLSWERSGKEGKISAEKEKTAPAVTTKFLPLSESYTLPYMLGSKMHFFLYGVMHRGESYLPSVTRAQNRGCSTSGAATSPWAEPPEFSNIPQWLILFLEYERLFSQNTPGEFTSGSKMCGMKEAGPLLLRPQTLWTSMLAVGSGQKFTGMTGKPLTDPSGSK